MKEHSPASAATTRQRLIGWMLALPAWILVFTALAMAGHTELFLGLLAAYGALLLPLSVYLSSGPWLALPFAVWAALSWFMPLPLALLMVFCGWLAHAALVLFFPAMCAAPGGPRLPVLLPALPMALLAGLVLALTLAPAG